MMMSDASAWRNAPNRHRWSVTITRMVTSELRCLFWNATVMGGDSILIIHCKNTTGTAATERLLPGGSLLSEHILYHQGLKRHIEILFSAIHTPHGPLAQVPKIPAAAEAERQIAAAETTVVLPV